MIQETGIIPEYQLNDSRVSPKAYCLILEMFLNNKKNHDYPTFVLWKQVCNGF